MLDTPKGVLRSKFWNNYLIADQRRIMLEVKDNNPAYLMPGASRNEVCQICHGVKFENRVQTITLELSKNT